MQISTSTHFASLIGQQNHVSLNIIHYDGTESKHTSLSLSPTSLKLSETRAGICSSKTLTLYSLVSGDIKEIKCEYELLDLAFGANKKAFTISSNALQEWNLNKGKLKR